MTAPGTPSSRSTFPATGPKPRWTAGARSGTGSDGISAETRKGPVPNGHRPLQFGFGGVSRNFLGVLRLLEAVHHGGQHDDGAEERGVGRDHGDAGDDRPAPGVQEQAAEGLTT